MNPTNRVMPNLETLIGLFYPSADELGRFREVLAQDIPEVFQQLLAHEHHMTVTVEKHHNSPVNVRVLDTLIVGSHYARKILLTRQTDNSVVQYGIMRVNFAYLDPQVQKEIESQSTPLGRILIQHNVHREIHLRSLWEVEAGPELQQIFRLPGSQVCYGRTAIIDCNDEPAIELLEIVPPVDELPT